MSAPVDRAIISTKMEDITQTLELALNFGWQLISSVDDFAFQLAFSELGEIDLPPAMQPEADSAQLQIAAPLYLAAELEAARVIVAAETIAGLAASGGLRGDPGEASEMLFQFWRARSERFTALERQAFFARLFGSDVPVRLATAGNYNQNFESLMIDLTDAIYNLAPAATVGARIRSQIPLVTIALRLAENIIPRSGGLASFAARDVLKTTQEALNLLKHPRIQALVGARSVWMAVSNIASTYLQEEVDVRSYVSRGRAGMLVLAWLAECYPRLGASGVALIESDDDTIIAAAADWLQASLNLEESRMPQQGASA